MFSIKFKYARLLLVTILAGIIATSCKKLDQEPQSQATNSAVFGSVNGLQLYANSFYEILPDAGALVRGDAMADYAARTSVPDFLRPGAFSAQQGSGWSWGQLRNINYFLANNVRTTVAEDQRRHFNGLARFFRAWFYFDKVKRFGDVPWINTPMNVDDPKLYGGRDSRAMVVDSIMADLDYAGQNILTTTDASRTQITKNIVYAFKSRVCLFEGTFRKYHTEYELGSTANTLLQQSVDAAKKVIDAGVFSVSTTGGTDKAYRQLFTSTTPNTNEVMLAAVVDPALGVFNDANWYWTSATYGDRLSLIRTFVNTYLNADGTPFTSKAGYKTMPFVDEVKGRDLRLQQTIRMGNYTRLNGATQQIAPPVFSYTYTGYQPIKLTQDDASMDGGSRNTNSIPSIRYAEVLLNYAEAKAELGTLTDADWNITVGALRRRAGITGNTATKPTAIDSYLQTTYFPSITDASILEIRRERSIELVFEGFRFNDIVRWKRGPLMDLQWNGFYVPALDTPLDLNGDGVLDVAFYRTMPANPVAGVTYVSVADNLSTGSVNPQRLNADNELTWLTNVQRKWDDKYYLYPIPESDRLINPKLGQNPGW
ncbi:MAG: RagB/SusD family nutrient uptake outer membrane protein [Mucilaginibacter sp.]|nr:RagB/SusD family nutrient uptake outer membrane protein [Mucilaginibacter sp.]